MTLLAARTSIAPPRFCVGDTVEVLRAVRLPKVEEVIGTGTVERVSGHSNDIYWISGFLCGRTASELRLVVRAR